ncbi:MAG: S46 family peptidase [Blastocatellia bacterium]|nr:S46 family peptidase [Blastocatellia bacterium]
MNSRKNVFLSLVLTFAVMLSSVSFGLAVVEEGMFTPDQIDNLNLRKKGLKIRPEEIYNPAGGGLTDAVVRLSVGCTSEFVSPDGLILTNHHCGFDALVSASAPGKDLVETGFKADNRAGEISAKGYSVFVTQRVENVTAQVRKGTESLTADAYSAAIKKNTEDLQAAEQAKAPAGSIIRIQSLNNGFYHYLYQTMQIKDIRVVYAPPRNIGVFGGDPDNFEWTRHTGDFTFLRAYSAPDGTSAEYSPNNVPYKPKKFLTMNIGGIKTDDFVFVLGYPGGTSRYRESQSIEYARDANFPFLASYLDARSAALRQIGETDEEKRIKFQSDIASFDNSRKVFKGGAEKLRNADVVNKRRAEEAQFATWINANPDRQRRYGDVLAQLKQLSEESNADSRRDVIVSRLPNPGLTPVLKQVYDAITTVQQGKTLAQAERAAKIAEIQTAYKDREPVYEREMIEFFLRMFAELPADQKFTAADNIFKSFEGRERRSAEEAFAASIAENDDFDTAEEIVALYGMSASDLRSKYPNIFSFVNALAQERAALTARAGKFGSNIDRVRLLYQQGMAEMKGITPYPDANSTLRFTYGYVKGYSPREAVTYTPFTTLKGMIEKDTGVNPFDVPQKLKDLQRTKDFGRFGSGDSVVVNFLSTTDIIGGNSGSPILNANGEQVGLCFDGNYEGLGNDLYYDANVGRTISVDIRFVLFVTEKFGNAGWILDEMKIVGGPKSMTARAGIN